MSIEVVVLGTGNPLPAADRAGPATLVRAGGRHVLFDCGRGAVLRLAAAGVVPVMLDLVALTHLHGDHVCALPDLVDTHWVMSMTPTALRLVGPPGTATVADGVRAMLGPDVSYRMAHHADLTWAPHLEVEEVGPGVVHDDGQLRIVAGATDHRPVEPTLGYRLEHGGASVVIAGDTVPCAGLDQLCRGADVYVQTVLRDDLVQLVPARRFQETIDYHSTVAQAADTAARAGVGTLVLTHQVPTPVPGAADEWVALARERFDGTVVFADDLTTVSA